MSGWGWGKITKFFPSQKGNMNPQGKQALEQELAPACCVIYHPDSQWFGFESGRSMVGGHICTLFTKPGASRDNDLTEWTRENLPPRVGLMGHLSILTLALGTAENKKKVCPENFWLQLYLSRFGLWIHNSCDALELWSLKFNVNQTPKVLENSNINSPKKNAV